jgi:hypothetical protein
MCDMLTPFHQARDRCQRDRLSSVPSSRALADFGVKDGVRGLVMAFRWHLSARVSATEMSLGQGG